jgi:hypothetical protein
MYYWQTLNRVLFESGHLIGKMEEKKRWYEEMER